MTALCGLAQSFLQLLLARIGVGIGEAGSSPPSHSIIADLYPSEQRAGAMGIYALAVVLGSGFGTMIGGWLAHLYGWRIAIVGPGTPGVQRRVEGGQLAIVTAVLPLAYGARRTTLYARMVFQGGSFAIMFVAALWLVQRSLDLKLL